MARGGCSRANWWPRLWPVVLSVALFFGGSQSSTGAARLECVLPGSRRQSLSAGRSGLFIESALVAHAQRACRSASARWSCHWPRHRSTSSRRGALSLVNKSLNGGLTVLIQPESGAYRLDVFVNFELEVNVWRDLSPDVEAHEYRRPAARCDLSRLVVSQRIALACREMRCRTGVTTAALVLCASVAFAQPPADSHGSSTSDEEHGRG